MVYFWVKNKFENTAPAVFSSSLSNPDLALCITPGKEKLLNNLVAEFLPASFPTTTKDLSYPHSGKEWGRASRKAQVSNVLGSAGLTDPWHQGALGWWVGDLLHNWAVRIRAYHRQGPAQDTRWINLASQPGQPFLGGACPSPYQALFSPPGTFTN